MKKTKRTTSTKRSTTTKKTISLADLSPEDRARLMRDAAADMPIEHVVHAFKAQRTRDIDDANTRRAAEASADDALRKAQRDAELSAERDAHQQTLEHREHYHAHGTVTKTPHGVVYASGCI